jgi:hypothetical protein
LLLGVGEFLVGFDSHKEKEPDTRKHPALGLGLGFDEAQQNRRHSLKNSQAAQWKPGEGTKS